MGSIICALCLWISLTSFDHVASTTEYVMIVNSNNTIGEMSKDECKLYYLKKVKKRWPGINKNIKPSKLKITNATQKFFYYNVLLMTEQDVEYYFSQKQYSSAELPPAAFDSESEIVQYVSNEIGAIGFVKESSIGSDMKSKVKIIYRTSQN
jgi:hypothetical protein